jgi:hypothetical protein
MRVPWRRIQVQEFNGGIWLLWNAVIQNQKAMSLERVASRSLA